jgi:hypothetical protein
MMSKKEIAKKYIEYLEQGNTEDIIDLFSTNGQVTSPIYGTKLASSFYNNLNEDTLNIKLIINGIFEEDSLNRIALYFEYNWTLKNKKNVTFDVVDIIEFNANNKITHLHIIYDTVKSRGFVSAMHLTK